MVIVHEPLKYEKTLRTNQKRSRKIKFGIIGEEEEEKHGKIKKKQML